MITNGVLTDSLAKPVLLVNSLQIIEAHIYEQYA